MAQITFKGKPMHTTGELPKVGSQAPDFVLVGSDLKDHSLKDFKGKKTLLSMVPSLDTPTCSLSAKKFNASAAKLTHATVLCISADLPFAQKRVCGAEKMTNILTLSMMRSKKFAEDYGILIKDGPLAGLCARSIVVLDENGRVLYTQLVTEISEEPDYETALRHLS